MEGRNSSGDHLLFKIKLDGKSTGWSNLVSPGRKVRIMGVAIDQTSERSFQFAELETTGRFHFTQSISLPLTVRRGRSDRDEVPPASASPALGVIHVAITRVRVVTVRDPKRFPKTPFQPMGVVHEESKKVGLHCITCVQVTSNPVKTSLTLGSKTWRTKGRACFRATGVGLCSNKQERRAAGRVLLSLPANWWVA